MNRFLRQRRSASGVRPLRYSGDAATVQLSRDQHCAVLGPNDRMRFPIDCLIGGKWTPFRAFAEHVANRLMERFGRQRRDRHRINILHPRRQQSV